MSLNYGTVTGRFVRTENGAEIPREGLTLRFIPSPEYFTSPTEQLHVIQQPIVATTDEDGRLEVQLLGTDDPTLNPVNWTWIVTISGPDFFELCYAFKLPAGATIDLADVARVPADAGQAIAEWATIRQTTIAEWTAAVAAAQGYAAGAAASANAAASSAATAAGSAIEAGLSTVAAHEEALAAAQERLAAAGFAVTANDHAIAAAASAQAADTARTGSEQAKVAAEAARDLALAGQFAGALLGAADLNTIRTPGMYKQTNGAEATLARNYPMAAHGGVLEVHSSGSTNFLIQRWTAHGGGAYMMRGIYIRRGNGAGVFDPWRFIPTQRIDQTAGRAIYTWDDVNQREQLIYGDTGWRDVTAELINGWTATVVLVRRVGVWIELRARLLSAANATAGTFLNLPLLVAWDGKSDPQSLQLTTDGKVRRLINATTTGFDGYATTDLFTRIHSTYSTVVPWPTTLPGTAVGSIPS